MDNNIIEKLKDLRIKNTCICGLSFNGLKKGQVGEHKSGCKLWNKTILDNIMCLYKYCHDNNSATVAIAQSLGTTWETVKKMKQRSSKQDSPNNNVSPSLNKPVETITIIKLKSVAEEALEESLATASLLESAIKGLNSLNCLEIALNQINSLRQRLTDVINEKNKLSDRLTDRSMVTFSEK